jgi:hypothetical protein
MSRSGHCWDNAVAESFFATLRAELVDHERYATREAAMRSIGDYITSTTSSAATRTSATSTPSSSNCDQPFNNVWHSQPVHVSGGSSVELLEAVDPPAAIDGHHV